MAKMQPFWWFLAKRLHPNYVCWYNSCEDCGEWNVNPAHACSVITDDFKEHTGSLQLMNETPSPWNGGLYTTLPLTECDVYFGFWAKWHNVLNPNNLYMTRMGVWGGTDYAILYFRTVSGELKWGWSAHVDVDTATGGDQPYTLGTWLWFEIRLRRLDRMLEFYVNGVSVGKWIYGVGYVFDAFDSFKVWQVGNQYRMGTIRLDYIRMADRFEYPPI